MPRLALFVVLFAVLSLFLAGCSRGPEKVITSNGTRVTDFDVSGRAICYTSRLSTPSDATEKLVFRDRATGNETVLESDFVGSFSLSGGRVAYFNRKLTDKDKDFVGPIVLYDAAEDQAKETLSARVSTLALDGKNLLVEKTFLRDRSTGSDVFLFDLDTGAETELSSGGEEATAYNETPALSGNTVAWLENVWRDKKFTLKIHDLASGKTADVPLPDRANFAVSGSKVVYSFADEKKVRRVHLYDVSSGADILIASLPRLVSEPAIEGDAIAWTEHIPKDRFKPIPGQPLMDEKDVRDVFVYTISSASKREIASALFATGARVRISVGRVYMNLYRNAPPPGASNLVVPVDLVVW